MNVLVTVATKHGATGDIGEIIAEELRRAGLTVETRTPEGITSLDGYEAVILGSSVYVGRWLDSASRFADRFAPELASREVWLFSSGPIGDPPMPEEEPAAALALVDRLGAREHRFFAGRLERNRLGLMERTITRALKAPEGDFRDWEAIRAWAEEIAATLGAPAGVV